MKKKPPKKAVKEKKRVGRILSPKEPRPFRLENEKGRGSGLILCDHASLRVPKALKDLGLTKKDLQRHIGWDIGAEDISRALGKMLDMPVLLASYSRLVVDLNRAPEHSESVMDESDGVKIPANTALSKQARAQRLKEIFVPYQKQVGKQVDRFTSKKRVPLLIAVHSFTPTLGGKKRPWHIAVLWNKQEEIARTLISGIRKAHPGLLVGENEPYSLKDGRFKGSTIDNHAEKRGLPYVFVEFRQDLVDTKEKAARWADIFTRALRAVLENPETFRPEKTGRGKNK